ncbi:MAG: sigma-70 family RNA polymerase sigma factor [Candidatus Nanopelagicales bacterium]
MNVGADDPVFNAVYLEHRRAVYRYLVRRGVDAADVDDACAEVFLVAWKRRADVPARAALVRPWLLGVARNVAFDNFRTTIKWERHPADTAAVAGRGADADVVGAETERMVWGSLRSLSDSDRELLLLVAWDGLTLRQAAAAIGCSYATTKVRLHRARKRFETVFVQQQHQPIIDLTGRAAVEARMQ